MQIPSVHSQTSPKGKRLRDNQATNQQGTAGGGQTGSSRRPAVKQPQHSEDRPSPYTSQLAGIKRKRSHDPRAEAAVGEGRDERLAKQPRRNTRLEPSKEDLQKGSRAEAEADDPESVRSLKQARRLSLRKDQLSENNLRVFNREMNSAANDIPVLKRTSSRRSIAASSEGETIRSQRSSNTTASYRYKHLAAADVHIHTDPSDDVQAAIDLIVKAEVSEDRRIKLCHIAKEFYDACKETVQAAAGEDDFVHIFRRALEAMNPDQILFREKADWREELKPIPQQSKLNLSFLVDFNAMESDQQKRVDDVSAPPLPKRQQQSVSQAYVSPQSSDVVDLTLDNRPTQSDTMPPSEPYLRLQRVKETSPIKTPRPDISMGTKEAALISALSALQSQNLNNTEARRFLKKLENTTPSERGGPTEPLLIAVPTQRASDLVFPFAVVEGKAYSTGKQIFEAQNQAAVSGASALKIQLSLNELVKRSTSDTIPSPPKNQPPLFFSICTEGPYHELWAHYTHIEDDTHKFNMKLLKICNGVLLEGVEDFIAMVDNVLRWGIGEFLESVVERLGQVAKKAGA